MVKKLLKLPTRKIVPISDLRPELKNDVLQTMPNGDRKINRRSLETTPSGDQTGNENTLLQTRRMGGSKDFYFVKIASVLILKC